jgi:hypothetical protein
MPRHATGNTYESHGRWYARITVGIGKRQSFALPTCANETAAAVRLAVLAAIAKDLRGAKVAPDLATQLLERAGTALEGKALAAVTKTAEALVKGEVRTKPTVAATFRDVAERWLSSNGPPSPQKFGPWRAADVAAGHVAPSLGSRDRVSEVGAGAGF